MARYQDDDDDFDDDLDGSTRPCSWSTDGLDGLDGFDDGAGDGLDDGAEAKGLAYSPSF